MNGTPMEAVQGPKEWRRGEATEGAQSDRRSGEVAPEIRVAIKNASLQLMAEEIATLQTCYCDLIKCKSLYGHKSANFLHDEFS